MPKSILVIENEEVLTDVLKSRLTSEGYRVKVAQEGGRGLELLRSERPDLVLLDLELPGKSGFEIMETINRNPELKRIPLIVISNSGEAGELERARESGAEDSLIKTRFDPDRVINKVEQQIGSVSQSNN